MLTYLAQGATPLFLLEPYDAAGCAQTHKADQTAKRPLTLCGDIEYYTGQAPVCRMVKVIFRSAAADGP
jgi:hypothetical protein